MRVPPGFTLLHKYFVCKVPHAFPPQNLASTGTLAGGGCRGTEFGGGWRWPLHSRCNMEAVGTEEILHRHLAN